MNGDEPVRGDAQARLFKGLFHGVLRDRLIYIAPAAGERPCAVRFVDEQNLSVIENRGAGINLRCLISGLVAEKLFDLFCRDVAFVGYHLGGYLSYPLVSLEVIGVVSICQPRLRETLELNGPAEPSVLFVHIISFLKGSVKSTP